MKKSSSKKLQNKNKTINTDNDAKTTKKSIINRSESCMKIAEGKSTMKESRKIDPVQLLRENSKLRQEFCRL